MLYRRGLNHFIITYACTRFPIIQPSMEWTLNTILVDDLTSYSEMCSHVKTVSLKGIYNFIFTFKDNQIVAIDVYRFHRSDLKLISFGNVVPSVWIGRWRFSQIFFGLLVYTLDEEMSSAELKIVQSIEHYECESVE